LPLTILSEEEREGGKQIAYMFLQGRNGLQLGLGSPTAIGGTEIKPPGGRARRDSTKDRRGEKGNWKKEKKGHKRVLFWVTFFSTQIGKRARNAGGGGLGDNTGFAEGKIARRSIQKRGLEGGGQECTDARKRGLVSLRRGELKS